MWSWRLHSRPAQLDNMGRVTPKIRHILSVLVISDLLYNCPCYITVALWYEIVCRSTCAKTWPLCDRALRTWTKYWKRKMKRLTRTTRMRCGQGWWPAKLLGGYSKSLWNLSFLTLGDLSEYISEVADAWIASKIYDNFLMIICCYCLSTLRGVERSRCLSSLHLEWR